MTASEVQQLLLSDPQARAEFANNPQAFLTQRNVQLPPGTQLPASIPLAELNDAVSKVQQHPAAQNLRQLKQDPAAVSNFVQNAFPARANRQQLNAVNNAVSAVRLNAGADDATVAVIAVVVAVPVAVFGFTGRGEEVE